MAKWLLAKLSLLVQRILFTSKPLPILCHKVALFKIFAQQNHNTAAGIKCVKSHVDSVLENMLWL